MTPEQLANIQARMDATSAGPWDIARGGNADASNATTKAEKSDFLRLSLNDETSPLWLVVSDEVIPAATGDGPRAKANAEFIAAARTDVPALLALVREQQARLDLLANQANAAEMLCRMNGGDPELAVVPAAAIRAALTATEGA